MYKHAYHGKSYTMPQFKYHLYTLDTHGDKCAIATTDLSTLEFILQNRDAQMLFIDTYHTAAPHEDDLLVQSRTVERGNLASVRELLASIDDPTAYTEWLELKAWW